MCAEPITQPDLSATTQTVIAGHSERIPDLSASQTVIASPSESPPDLSAPQTGIANHSEVKLAISASRKRD